MGLPVFEHALQDASHVLRDLNLEAGEIPDRPLTARRPQDHPAARIDQLNVGDRRLSLVAD